ncbi:MAG: bifunctional diaminohydroxyphosphoribosylaminopyrimidine deaminase/5-amino-6-(5-phosphoribosylamino)uracil reductase RibD [Planctomycetota bacterium]
MTDDERFMAMAVERATLGRGHVEPNPMVGCVLVRDDKVIGIGHHERYGSPHAEPNALADAGDARGATAYVTLEPCCYTGHGKQTPPCTPRLIEAGVRRVVIGCVDPNPHVAGNGIRQLREAGIVVESGVFEAECATLIRAFRLRVEERHPMVTLKWAESRDGRVAGRQGRPVRITGDLANSVVHELRGRCDAIAVGTNTLVNDDPQLTARGDNPPRRAIRVVLSNSLKLPPERSLWQPGPPTVIYTHDQAPDVESPASHVEVIRLPSQDNGRGGRRFGVGDVLSDLFKRGVTHLLVEPGPKLAADLLRLGQVDRVWRFKSKRVDIGESGLVAPELDWPTIGEVDLGDDVLSEHAFDCEDRVSVDFRLARSLATGTSSR